MSQETILVPTDFSEAAERALEYAASLARVNHGAVRLLHVLTTADNNDSEQKLIRYASEKQKQYGVPLEHSLRKGSIYHTISEVASELSVPIVVMGNHGAASLKQQLFGPNALKVVNSSCTPFLLVKKESRPADFTNIVLPIDHTTQLLEKLNIAVSLAKMQDGTVHLFVQTESVEVLTHAIQKNVSTAVRRLDNEGVNYTLTQQTEHGPGFAAQIVSYAQLSDAGLIVINSDAHTGNVKIAYGYSDERIINNEAGIPVMCMHSSR